MVKSCCHCCVYIVIPVLVQFCIPQPFLIASISWAWFLDRWPSSETISKVSVNSRGINWGPDVSAGSCVRSFLEYFQISSEDDFQKLFICCWYFFQTCYSFFCPPLVQCPQIFFKDTQHIALRYAKVSCCAKNTIYFMPIVQCCH